MLQFGGTCSASLFQLIIWICKILHCWRCYVINDQAVSDILYSTDTYLTLYDASGAVLASNDDGTI